MTISPGFTILASDILAIQTGAIASGTIVAGTTIDLITQGGGTIVLSGTIAGGGGGPGGSSGQIQINNSGAFGGVALDPSLAVSGGTIGIAPIAVNSLLANTGTVSAIPSALAIGAGLSVLGGTIITTGTYGAVNFTSGTGIQWTGQPIINVGTANAFYMGVQAGYQSQTGTIAPGLGCTFIGSQAGYSNAGGSENTYLGYVAGYGMISGSHNTGLGVGAMGYSAPFDFGCTYVGCDAGRNAAAATAAGGTTGNNTHIGSAAGLGGGGVNNTSLGASVQYGNSAALLVGGTITTTDTIQLVFTSTQASSTASSISGSVLTVGGSVTGTYLVGQVLMAGATNVGTIASNGSGTGGAGTYNLTSPIATSSTTIAGGVFQPQTLSVAMTGLTTTAQAANAIVTAFTANSTLYATNRRQAVSNDPSYVSFNMNGASTTGDCIAVTGTVVGAATETVTITNGLSGIGNNVFIGYYAARGYYQTTAYYNVGIGTNTFYWLTTGFNNIAVGQQSAGALNTGSNNILLGVSSGALLTTATQNIAIGTNALTTGTTNSACTAVGYTAAQFTTGNFNTVIGGTAGVGVNGTSTYANVTLLGYAAGRALTTANGVTLIGSSAGIALTSGANNTFVGLSAGAAATTANKSVFVGDSAGLVNISGFQNTLIGSSAGHALTGSSCTMIGYTAGNLVTGNNNTILGNQVASTTLTTGTGNILIGTSSSVDTPATSTSNYLNIGGVIVGNGINTANTSTISVPGTLTLGGHLRGISGTAPTIGAGGSLDANASDVAGTVTGGTASTGWTITWGTAYAVTPHVVVSSPNGSFFTSYTASTSGLTLVNLSATGAIFTYIVVG